VTLSVSLIASLALYYGGMVLNDCIDIEEDKRNNPTRPLASGKISRVFAWVLVCSLILFALGLVLIFSEPSAVWAFLLAVSIVAYNLSAREGLLGCFIMGACRTLNWLLALSMVGAVAEYSFLAIFVGIYVTALTFVSRDEDYAERPWLMKVSAGVLAIGLLYLIASVSYESYYQWVGVGLLVLGAGAIYYKMLVLLRDYNTSSIRALLMFLILGMIPLDACLALMAGYPLAALFVAFLLLPSRLLAKYLYVT